MTLNDFERTYTQNVLHNMINIDSHAVVYF